MTDRAKLADAIDPRKAGIGTETTTFVDQPVTVSASVLIAAADALRAMEWRPIKTAPRDGTYALLRFEGPFRDQESPAIAVGRYYAQGPHHWWVTCIWAGSATNHEPIAWLQIPGDA